MPVLFCKLHDFLQFFTDGTIILTAMGAQALGAILDAILRIGETTASVFTQGIQRAIAEDTAKGLRVCPAVAGKILTFPVLIKIIMAHNGPLKNKSLRTKNDMLS